MSTFVLAIQGYGIYMRLERIPSNPDAKRSDWSDSARHYRITLKCAGREMTLFFSQGCGCKASPKLADVLSCLQSDATLAEMPFVEMCAEIGGNSDSISDLASYHVMQRNAEALKSLLGLDLFRAFLSLENDY